MTLNELRDEAFAYAEKQGFHGNVNFGEKLMLVVSELSEALEADRKKKWAGNPDINDGRLMLCQCPEDFGRDEEEVGFRTPYELFCRGTVEEEIADAMIRLFDLASIYKIDLDWHVRAKMAYNKTRPYKCGKNYG
jgi:NTP pyrophosphatase (non-canonical NTP hydrolase)